MASRRAVLLAAGFSIASAGCLSTGSDTVDTVDVWAVTIFNDDDTAHTLTVRIEENDGTTVFERTPSVGAKTGKNFADPVDDAGDYTVVVSFGDETARSQLIETVSGEESCVWVKVRIDYTGRLFLEFIRWNSC